MDAVNRSGGFERGGHSASLRPVLRATAENFAAGASAFSGITRAGIASGRLTDEDLELIARSRPGRRTSGWSPWRSSGRWGTRPSRPEWTDPGRSR
jgi:hypothetical protein